MRKSAVIIILLGGIVLFTGVAAATERHVPSTYPTIQEAINACNNGDVVIVAPGTYTGPGNRDINFLGKAITVKSEKWAWELHYRRRVFRASLPFVQR